jgi:hypothetical protein
MRINQLSNYVATTIVLQRVWSCFSDELWWLIQWKWRKLS